jgi:periplasmic protein TonB
MSPAVRRGALGHDGLHPLAIGASAVLNVMAIWLVLVAHPAAIPPPDAPRPASPGPVLAVVAIPVPPAPGALAALPLPPPPSPPFARPAGLMPPPPPPPPSPPFARRAGLVRPLPRPPVVHRHPRLVSPPPPPDIKPPHPAPLAPSPEAPPMAEPVTAPSWQAQLLAWVEAHKTYPPLALQQGDEGVVVAQFTVDRSGHVSSPVLRRRARAPELNQAVLDMLKGASVPPFPASMTAASVTVTIPIKYSLND